MSLTQQDLQQIVKVLDPKFKRIDERFEQVGKQFKDMNIEIGNMIAPLSTKHEMKSLEKEVSGTNDRIDELIGRYNEFCGDTADFESKVMQHFDHIHDSLKVHDQQFARIMNHVGTHSEQFRTHDRRITALEAK